MKIDEWVVREVIDTLRQANITLLGVTILHKSLPRNARRTKPQSIVGLRTPLAYWNHQ